MLAEDTVVAAVLAAKVPGLRALAAPTRARGAEDEARAPAWTEAVAEALTVTFEVVAKSELPADWLVAVAAADSPLVAAERMAFLAEVAVDADAQGALVEDRLPALLLEAVAVAVVGLEVATRVPT